MWTFLCILCGNSSFRVHLNKRLCFPLFMALCIPIPLWQRTSRVYQDHLCFQRSSLPSFRLSITRVSDSLPYKVIALWKIFLPTTGSLFVFFITDLCSLCRHDIRGRFPCHIFLGHWLSLFHFSHPS